MIKFSMMILSLAIVLGLFISPGYSKSITLYSTVDTYVRNESPSSSYGGYTNMDAGFWGTETLRVFVKFDLSAIPDNSIITKADLTLYLNAVYEPARTYNIYYVPGDNLVTNTMTWNTQPTTNLTYLGAKTVPNPFGASVTWSLSTVSWPYSNDLKDNFVSFRISAASEAAPNTYVRFHTSEVSPGNTNDPRLVIEYQPKVVALPAMLSPLLGSD